MTQEHLVLFTPSGKRGRLKRAPQFSRQRANWVLISTLFVAAGAFAPNAKSHQVMESFQNTG